MGMRQLWDQPMRAQQAQLTAHRRRAATRRFFVPWLAGIEQALQIAISESGQKVPIFVAGFLPVEPGAMFEAHPFVTAQDIGWHLTLETGIHASGVHRHMMTQKAHDVWALKGAQAVEHEGAVHSGQVAPILKEQVGGVFALGDTRPR